ncbi:cell division protein SepF [Actinoallomurus soli]|uniref:cell division protein SepF n=1 Tax=Actinoallomurus soli TaxID=2952535 RepID=UPI002091F217|nr:cell division protein SepF [Actinoallomurus soli]MCO5970229.1 cell division protein SepF [Actinoallomurus soli]
MRPRDYNDVRYVGHYFRQGVLVVMDLTEMTDDEGRQLVDFAAGLICGRGGDMQRLGPKVFLLIPSVPAGPGTTTGVVKRLRPRDYNEVLHVGHYFREGVPVVMDLTEMTDEEARQLVDFSAGLICARGGDMERLGSKVFLLVPAGLARPSAAALQQEKTAPEPA